MLLQNRISRIPPTKYVNRMHCKRLDHVRGIARDLLTLVSLAVWLLWWLVRRSGVNRAAAYIVQVAFHFGIKS